MDTMLEIIQAYIPRETAAGTTFILLTAAAVFGLSLAAFAFVFALASPLRRRLNQLRREQPGTDAPRATTIADLLRPFSAYVLPRKEWERSRVQRLLVCAGYRSDSSLSLFYATKALLMLGLPLAVLIASPLLPKLTTGNVVFWATAAGFLGSLLPSMWVERRALNRQRELRVAFPDALDLLVVCVESGLGLAPALQRVADELAVSHPELGTELALVNAEMRAGVERTQALKNFAARTGLEDIRGLTALLVQTMRFGTSVADALRVYSEEFRDKRMQAAEEQAAKIGTKMIFPLVFCLFPSFFLVAIGPAVLRLVEVFRQLAH